MALTSEDIEALRMVVREEIHHETQPLREEVRNMQGELKEVSSRTARQGATHNGLEQGNKTVRGDIQATRDAMVANFDAVNENFSAIGERLEIFERNMNDHFDALSKKLETTEQENLVIKHQLGELEKKVA